MPRRPEAFFFGRGVRKKRDEEWREGRKEGKRKKGRKERGI